MYFGSHNSTSQVRLFSWPENSGSVTAKNVNIAQWNPPPYAAPGPDGRNWLGRCDPRITGAALTNGVINLAWTVKARDNRPFPHVRVVQVDAANMNLLGQPDIWSPNYAYAYPALSSNPSGVLGITLFRGGGNLRPGHVVGVRDESLRKWVLQATRDGTDGPIDGKWGDYLGIVRTSGSGNSWFASGYTLRGGGNRNDIEPRVVQFGYRSS